MNCLSGLSAVGTVDVAEMMEMMMMTTYIFANARLSPLQTEANAANVTAEISVESLLWDGVKVEKQDAFQAGANLEDSLFRMNVKQRAVLQAGSAVDVSLKYPQIGATEQTAG